MKHLKKLATKDWVLSCDNVAARTLVAAFEPLASHNTMLLA
jgi:hypothetical protein